MTGLVADAVPPKTPLPNDCVILSVFSEIERTGYAIAAPKKMEIYSGGVPSRLTPGDRVVHDVISKASSMAREKQRPLIVVMEEDSSMRLDPRRRALKRLGVRFALDMWRDAMHQSRVPKSRILIAKTSWRGLFFEGVEQNDERALALVVQKHYGKPVNGTVEPLTRHEEMMAIGLATWSRYDWDVFYCLRAIGKRYP